MDDRTLLPYREKSELFLLVDKHHILAQDHQHYIMFPGGGIDTGENPETGAKRELEEETGHLIEHMCFHSILEWDWFPEWANTPKRKERYAQFRGERIHLFCGIASQKNDLGDEEDKWRGQMLLTIADCLEKLKAYAAEDHPNTLKYRAAQESAIRQALHMQKM